MGHCQQEGLPEPRACVASHLASLGSTQQGCMMLGRASAPVRCVLPHAQLDDARAPLHTEGAIPPQPAGAHSQLV